MSMQCKLFHIACTPGLTKSGNVIMTILPVPPTQHHYPQPVYGVRFRSGSPALFSTNPLTRRFPACRGNHRPF